MKEIDKKEEIIKVGSMHIAITRFGYGKPVLCFHGWLDNSASFHPLIEALFARELRMQELQFITIDFPGHGLSEHHAPSSNQYFIDLLIFIYRLYQSLEIKEASIIAHSMGAGASSLFAGAFPEMVSRLVLIDGLGPITDEPDFAVHRVRNSLSKEMKSNLSKNRVYKNLTTAIEIRMKSGPLSKKSASLLVDRGMQKVKTGYSWTYDPRLKYPSVARLIEKQVLSFLEEISCKALLILANDSKLGEFKSIIESRIQHVKNLDVVKLTGGHHLHMENAHELSRFVEPMLISWLND